MAYYREMPVSHTVEEGDSVIRLSERYGLFAPTIWNDAANAGLRLRRADMNILMPGDVVVIPDLRPKFEKRPTGKTHRFRRKGVPAIFRLQLFDRNREVADQEYTLIVDGIEKKGKTDDQGILEEYVPAGAKEGELKLGQDEDQVIVKLQFGYLDPLNEVSGVQHRLANLGYDCGEESGVLNEETKLALQYFQRDNKLEPTGEIDAATKSKLEEIHDRPYRYPDPDNGAAA